MSPNFMVSSVVGVVAKLCHSFSAQLLQTLYETHPSPQAQLSSTLPPDANVLLVHKTLKLDNANLF